MGLVREKCLWKGKQCEWKEKNWDPQRQRVTPRDREAMKKGRKWRSRETESDTEWNKGELERDTE